MLYIKHLPGCLLIQPLFSPSFHQHLASIAKSAAPGDCPACLYGGSGSECYSGLGGGVREERGGGWGGGFASITSLWNTDKKRQWLSCRTRSTERHSPQFNDLTVCQQETRPPIKTPGQAAAFPPVMVVMPLPTSSPPATPPHHWLLHCR